MAQHALDGSAMTPQEKPVVLIADDSRVVRVSLKNILKDDCLLIEAEDGQQAWEHLLETPDIRLIFSDLGMPKVDGRELLEKIRNSEITRIRNIPFIVVTGNEEDGDARDDLQNLGATEVVSKPFDPAHIVSFVSTLTSSQDSESYMLLPEHESLSQSIPNVHNQHDFMQSASKELSFAIRNKNELAIALLRIDQFDQLASHYSGPAIEHILMAAAEIIRTHIHPDDTMAYFGDGLFAILRPASNAIGTRYIGRRIIDDLASKQFYLGESEDLVTASIGVSAPHIKPGIRLRELLLLAEGRLKAAIDLGGNRVVDKGNDTLTPLGLASDSGPGQSSEPPNGLHSDSILSSHLRMDSALSSGEYQKRLNVQDMEDKIRQLESVIEGLTHENKDLEGQNERLRKQSGDTEKFRQRVFELESEQQQMQLKLNEFVDDNERLRNRATDAEAAHQKLLDKEQEESLTLQQANQFYEQENLRLEGQMEALSSRAQKAELAYRKSEQLVISLKDNIKLMRAQMEQIQQQLAASQQQPEPVQSQAETAINDITSLEDEEETHLEQRTDSELMIDGFPSSKPVTEMENEPAEVVQLFAEPAQLTPEQSRTPPAKEPEAAAVPRAETVHSEATPADSEKPDISIPVYRAPPKDKPFKVRKPLSSFTIASLIMLTLLFAGFGYVYYSWQDEPSTQSSDQAAQANDAPDEIATSKKFVPQQEQTQADQELLRKSAEPAGASEPNNSAFAPPQTRSHTTQDTTIAVERADEEARLQVELTLRQMAEEEFQMRLQETTGGSPQQAAETLSQPSAVEVTDVQEQTISTQPTVTSETMANPSQQSQDLMDSTVNLPPIPEDKSIQATE